MKPVAGPPTGSRSGRPVESYSGRTAVLATKHGKLELIGPPLAQAGLVVRGVEVDTDVLGTFSGEVPRPAPPVETAVAKARLGMEVSGCSLGIASEGSIGPHPGAPLLTVAVEYVVLVDAVHDLVLGSSATGLDVQATSRAVRPGSDPGYLAELFDLPTHAVIVRPNRGPPSPLSKGLADPDAVEEAVASCAAVSPDGLARVETDLRAHVCPSRRPTIRVAAERLAARLLSRCPACTSPGWGFESVVTGVPCDWCGTEVDEVRAEVHACSVCGFSATRTLLAEGATADPGRCSLCNP